MDGLRGFHRRFSPLRLTCGLVCTGALLTPGGALPGFGEEPRLASTQDVRLLDYENRRLEGPLSIHILRFDPRRQPVVLGRAYNAGVGREAVSSIARRHGAEAAINGGFFRIGGRYDGDPSGVLKIGDSWFSDAPVARAALGWTRDGARTLIGRVKALCELKAGEKRLPVGGLNRPRGRNESLLFNWAFHRTTLTDPTGTEVLVGPDGIVLSVRRGGDSPIPPNGFVYSIGPDATDIDWTDLEVGDRLQPICRLEPQTGGNAEAWNQLDFVVGGTPVLVQDGEPITDYSAERLAADFTSQRHPRTAVGVRPDGSWVLVVVDGRQRDLSIGMTLSQLATLMQQLGCRNALNLDGGGSTTIFLDGRVVNSPSDFGVERPVSEALLVLPGDGS